MPSTLGSAELKFAKSFVTFANGEESEIKFSVNERHLYRKLFVAVVPTSSDWTDYWWRGRVEFRLKGNVVETWRIGFSANPAAEMPEFNQALNKGVAICPPFWVETFAAASMTALWPVVAPGADEQTAIVVDTNTGDMYRVHMKPTRFTGHFDEVAFICKQTGTETLGEDSGYLILGCLSEPLGD